MYNHCINKKNNRYKILHRKKFSLFKKCIKKSS